MLKDLLLGYMIAHTFFLRYTLLTVVSLESLFTLKTPLCALILLRDKHDYATPITCDNNPKKNIFELDPDSDDQ